MLCRWLVPVIGASFPLSSISSRFLDMTSTTTTKVGHGLAKILGIKLHYRNPTGRDDITRGESVFSVSSADTYVEQEPTSLEWIQDVLPTGRGLLRYAYNLFPFVHWIGRYNTQWFYGDLVAGACFPTILAVQLS